MPKKKTALTIEERLQQALVPAEEQPYEVPENWVWVRLGSFIDLLRGVSYKKHDVHNEKMENDCLILRGGNIIEGGLDLNADNVYVDKSLVSEAQLIRRNDIIIVSSTGSVKVIGRAGLAFCDYNDVAFGAFLTLARPKNRCNKSFVDLFFQSFLYRQRIRELASGVNINNIRSEYITNMQFPLPPLSEQQRIVERIEELFAKLDEAKERLQDVAENFAVRKAAILHKAFTGELTKQWRRENGVSDESWEERKLGEVGSWLGGGTPSTSREEYWENGNILWITSKDMKSTVIEDTLMKVNEIGVKNSSANYIEKPALLVVMRSGILRRTFPVAMVKKPFTVNQDLKAIIPDEDDLEFLYWMLLSNEQRILNTCMKNGTTVESINSNALKNLTFKCPSLPEQHEIVRLIDDLLARERAAQQAAEQALASIDLMKKSILARAFRGELGTNKASEVSALELLRQVLAEN